MEKKRSKTIGALWLYQKQDEETGKKTGYFSGTLDLGVLGQAKIAVFKNNRKERDNQPDYNIVLSEPKRQDEPVEVDDDSDIPF